MKSAELVNNSGKSRQAVHDPNHSPPGLRATGERNGSIEKYPRELLSHTREGASTVFASTERLESAAWNSSLCDRTQSESTEEKDFCEDEAKRMTTRHEGRNGEESTRRRDEHEQEKKVHWARERTVLISHILLTLGYIHRSPIPLSSSDCCR